jgi:hypothetical protein
MMKNPRNRKPYRLSLILGTSLGLGLLGLGTANASLLPGGWGEQWQDWTMSNLPSPIADVLAQIEQTTTLAEDLLQEALGQQWESLKTALESQLPDPFRVRTEDLETTPSVLTENPMVQQQELANLYDQEVARTMAAPWLGEAGQTRMTSEAQQTAAVLETSKANVQSAQSMANTAQGLSVSQDILKQNAQIQATVASLLHEQTQITAENQTALMQLQQLQSIQTQLAANTSEGIDAANRRQRLDRQIAISGSVSAPLFIPGALGTDTSISD